MTVEESVVLWLRASTAVNNAGVTDANITDEAPPRDASYPRITVQRISGSEDQHLAGTTGLATARIQVDVWASTRASRSSVAEAVRGRCSGAHNQTFGTGGLAVHGCTLLDWGFTYEPPLDAQERGVYRATMEFWVRYAISVPSY